MAIFVSRLFRTVGRARENVLEKMNIISHNAHDKLKNLDININIMVDPEMNL